MATPHHHLSLIDLLFPFPPRVSLEKVFVPKQYFQDILHS